MKYNMHRTFPQFDINWEDDVMLMNNEDMARILGSTEMTPYPAIVKQRLSPGCCSDLDW